MNFVSKLKEKGRSSAWSRRGLNRESSKLNIPCVDTSEKSPENWNLWLLSNLCDKQFYRNPYQFSSNSHPSEHALVQKQHQTKTNMSKRRAVTHADLEPKPPGTYLGSKAGAALLVLTILVGLLCFVLCLVAEASRSLEIRGSAEEECRYSGSGETPLLCAAGAFAGLAVAMVVEHIFLLVAISKSPPLAVVTWDPELHLPATLTCQAGFFFIATWVCFAVAEILLLIGLSVESGHLKNWSRARASCLILKQGIFCAAGVFALVTVFLAAFLYLIALQAQKLFQQHENVRREVLEASAMYTSPIHPIAAVAREDPVAREARNELPQLAFSPGCNKHVGVVWSEVNHARYTCLWRSQGTC